MTLASHHETVIVGGGIAGLSVAYHLAKLGRTDIVLLERHQLTSGTTWHAAGLIMQLRSTHAMTALARYNVELYSRLEAETGQATGFKQNGTLGVCRTRDRLFETQRLASIARSFDIEAEMIGPSEAKAIYPALNEKIIEGAIFIPRDGQTNPVDTAMAVAAGARQNGVKIVENCGVRSIARQKSGDYRVETQVGPVTCGTLVLACGLWTRDLAAQLGIRIPLHPCEHFYVVTEPLASATPNLPVLRDTDGHTYVKEDAGKWLVGAFEPVGKAIAAGALPTNVPFIELPEDWDHFALPFSKAMELLPDLERAGIAKFFNGPESFTPDLLFMVGEAPGNPNCFISAGYNSEGIEFGAGAGRALAEWIVGGEPTVDLSHVDVARFHPFQINRKYLHDRASEIVGLHYKPHWPHYQMETARNVRKSALHDRWASLNASFGEGHGWERPMWFAPRGQSAANLYSHRRPNWFGPVSAECAAARNAAILLDQSSFAGSRPIEIGYATIIANRLTYVGELGWELHVPTEFVQHVFDVVWQAGVPLGLKPAGYHALEHLRSERAYREYGLDLTPEDTPLEAGLGFTVALDKPIDFTGRDALLRQRERALTKRLVMFALKDPEPVLWHDEPIRLDGTIVGYVSSGAYGFTLGRSVAMGYVTWPDGVTADLVASGRWQIERAGENFDAEASLRAFYDPSGSRTKI